MSNKISNAPILELRHIQRSFFQGQNSLQVLKDISFTVSSGEIIALVGASGTGKSTLLQICGLLESPSQGQLLIEGQDTRHLNDDKRTAIRRNKIGFVYQFHHLLPEFSALENILLPQMIVGKDATHANARALDLLSAFSLEERKHHRPAQLSGGEQQRIAILRAVANRPRLLLADEPTGNLDEATAEKVFHELLTLVRQNNMGAVIVTHNLELAQRMDKVYKLTNGVLEAA